MVNTLSHIGIGLLLAHALGLKGRKRLGLVLLSIVPDIDYFSYSLFTLISGSVSHEARNQLFYLLGHRELTHSVFFAVILAVLIWIKPETELIHSEVFWLSSFTASGLYNKRKNAPIYPFSLNESALRAIYPFDPVVNVIPLLPLFIVAAEYIKSRGVRKYKRSMPEYQDLYPWDLKIGENGVFGTEMSGTGD